MNKMWKVFLIICFLCVSGCMKKDEKIVKSDQKEREITLHIQVIHEVEKKELMKMCIRDRCWKSDMREMPYYACTRNDANNGYGKKAVKQRGN